MTVELSVLELEELSLPNAPYDSTADVIAHRVRVQHFLRRISLMLLHRGESHDLSKFSEPEKSIYDQWKPVLDTLQFGTPQYQEVMRQMGEGLAHHFAFNRHHPEYFPNGVNGMTLIDLLEMFADWMAVSRTKNIPLALDVLTYRFGLSDQLREIIANTEKEFNHV